MHLIEEYLLRCTITALKIKSDCHHSLAIILLTMYGNKKGHEIVDKETITFCYADDTVILADNKDDKQKLPYQFYKTANEIQKFLPDSN